MNEDHRAADAIATEACAWIARLESGELSLTELAAFREWIRRSPRHAAEINRLAHLSADLERLTDSPLQSTNVDIDAMPVEPAAPRRGRSSLALGAGAVAALLLVAVTLALWRPAANDTIGPLATPVGGYLEQELSDGSLVRLNTDSRVTVAYEGARRTVHLDRGEVYFRVVRDDDRPFLVRTNGREVLALGTAFVVRLQDERISVMVTEGRVAISQRNVAPRGGAAGGTLVAPPPAPILLQAGQNYQDSPTSAPPVTRVAKTEVQRQLAWQRGLVEFTDTPLDDVVEDVSRYTNLTIRFDDPELRTVRFGGMFPTGEIHRLFGVLESTYGISVAYVDESTVSLTSAR